MSVKTCFLATLLLFIAHSGNAGVKQFSRDGNTRNIPPVVFVPGDGGSVVEARLNFQGSTEDSCDKRSDWFRLWLNLEEMLPYKLQCQVEYMRLIFDPKTNTSRTPAGVETRIPGFGTSHSIEYIDDSWAAYLLHNIGAYAHALVDALTSHGYERDVSIRGAPYDFRLSMYSQRSYFQRLRRLIEQTYADNNNSKVALISHSMGGFYTTWFLNGQSQDWKAKYIDCFISLSTPWGGSSESLLALTSGFTFHVPVIDPLVVRKEQRSWESNFLLLPNAKLWPKNRSIVVTDQQNYTASRDDMVAMFNRLGVTSDIYQFVRDANDPVSPNGVMPPHPGVQTFCLYGTDMPTGSVLDYRGRSFPDEQPEIVTVPGDGTVSHESLSACRDWNLGDGVVPVASATHLGLLQDATGIDAVLKILLNRPLKRLNTSRQISIV